MLNIIPLKDFKKQRRMGPVMVRLPDEIREQAQKLAASQSSESLKVTETDVYRTAIIDFLDRVSTDSRQDNPPPSVEAVTPGRVEA